MLQRTEEWHQARLGKLTGSRIADATARTKSGWGASRDNYMTELLLERITGVQAPHYVNAAMQWGTDREPDAFAAYEFERNVDLVPVGFIAHPMIPMSGASPDPLVGEDGTVEVKCPETKTHITTLITETIDGGYIKQMQWGMACTGRKWCDFVSYDPRVPLEMQLYIHRVHRDDAMIAKLEADAIQFLKELDTMEVALRAKFGLKEAA